MNQTKMDVGLQPINQERRLFALHGVRSLGLLLAAQTTVYVVGSAFKHLDGNLTAGAKSWNMFLSGGTARYGCGRTDYSCPPSVGSCTTAGAVAVVSRCGCDANEWMSAKYRCE